MTVKVDEPVHAYFLSYVAANYSRSGNLFNAKSQHLEKEYIQVSPKWHKLSLELLKIRKSMKKNSIVVVMSPSQKIAFLSRLILKRKIFLDAGWPLIDGVLSRGVNFGKFLKLIYNYFIDMISFYSAHLILVESHNQLERVHRLYCIPRSRIRVSYTGLNEIAFSKKFLPSSKYLLQKCEFLNCPKRINVIFRGSLNNESGIIEILSAAKMLVNEVNLIIVADRRRLPPNLPDNCYVFSHISEQEMQDLYSNCQVALGQISIHNRLNYTIPHKAFEAGFFRKVFVTPRSGGISELYSESAVCFIDDVTPEGLVESLRLLYSDVLREQFENQIFKEYTEKVSQFVIGANFDRLVRETIQSSKRESFQSSL